MKTVIRLIDRAGRGLHPWATVALILGLNVQWAVTLQGLDSHFQEFSGVPLLDLENVQGVLSAPAAQALISQYSDAAISLYWTFFVMDNVVPLLSFGSFALLWAYLLSRSRWSISRRLANSWFLLIPFGVGGFDIVENTFFVSALASGDPDTQLILLTWGLAFVQAKAAVIFATFAVTLLLIAFYVGGGVRRLVGGRVTGRGGVGSAASSPAQAASDLYRTDAERREGRVAS